MGFLRSPFSTRSLCFRGHEAAIIPVEADCHPGEAACHSGEAACHPGKQLDLSLEGLVSQPSGTACQPSSAACQPSEVASQHGGVGCHLPLALGALVMAPFPPDMVHSAFTMVGSIVSV